MTPAFRRPRRPLRPGDREPRLAFYGISNPIHFDILPGNGSTSRSGQSTAAVNVLDPALGAAPFRSPLTPLSSRSASTPDALLRSPIRTFAVPPTTFATAADAARRRRLPVASNRGVSRDARRRPGSRHADLRHHGRRRPRLGRHRRQARRASTCRRSAAPTDQLRARRELRAGHARQPNPDRRHALQLRGRRRSPATSLYLYSPGRLRGRRRPFTLGPGRDAGPRGRLRQPRNERDARSIGPVRIAHGDRQRRRSPATRPLAAGRRRTGAASATLLRGADDAADALGAGSTSTLFTGARDAEISILGLYSLDRRDTATLTLFGAGRDACAGRAPFTIAIRTSLSSSTPRRRPSASTREPGDVVRVTSPPGRSQPYVLVLDPGTPDVAPSLPVQPLDRRRSFPTRASSSEPTSTELRHRPLPLQSRSGDASSVVSVTYYPLYGAAGSRSTQRTSRSRRRRARSLADVLTTSSGSPPGRARSSSPRTCRSPPPCASARARRRRLRQLRARVAGTGGSPRPRRTAFGLPADRDAGRTCSSTTAGAAGTVTVTGFLADGTPAGQVAVALGDHAPGRLDSVFAALGVTNQPAGRDPHRRPGRDERLRLDRRRRRRHRRHGPRRPCD